MNKTNESKKDFFEFLNAPPEEHALAQDATSALLHARLKKERYLFYSKAIGVSVLSVLVSILLCPQLGVGYFGDHYGLVHFFMSAGVLGCAFLCGVFLLFFNALGFFVFLSPLELKRLGTQKGKVFMAYSFAAFLFILFFGQYQTPLEPVFWFLGLSIMALTFYRLVPKVKYSL
jgi:hypothetical protein